MKRKYKVAIMKMAKIFAETSECSRLKVGAIIYKNDNIISMGVNGTRAGFYTNKCELDTGETSPHVRHAEIAALDKLRKSHETSIGASLYVTHACCLNCAIEVVDAGISEVIFEQDYRMTDGINYLIEHGVEVSRINCE